MLRLAARGPVFSRKQSAVCWLKAKLDKANLSPKNIAARHEAVRGIPERTGKKTDGRGMKPCRRHHYVQEKGESGDSAAAERGLRPGIFGAPACLRLALAHARGVARYAEFSRCGKESAWFYAFRKLVFPCFSSKTTLAWDLLTPGGCVRRASVRAGADVSAVRLPVSAAPADENGLLIETN